MKKPSLAIAIGVGKPKGAPPDDDPNGGMPNIDDEEPATIEKGDIGGFIDNTIAELRSYQSEYSADSAPPPGQPRRMKDLAGILNEGDGSANKADLIDQIISNLEELRSMTGGESTEAMPEGAMGGESGNKGASLV